MSGGRRIGRILVDTTPLRLDRDYRWLWTGQVIAGMGSQITRLALPFQVYALTGSTLAIAALTVFQLVPILLFALIGGSLAALLGAILALPVTAAGRDVVRYVFRRMSPDDPEPLAETIAKLGPIPPNRATSSGGTEAASEAARG